MNATQEQLYREEFELILSSQNTRKAYNLALVGIGVFVFFSIAFGLLLFLGGPTGGFFSKEWFFLQLPIFLVIIPLWRIRKRKILINTPKKRDISRAIFLVSVGLLLMPVALYEIYSQRTDTILLVFILYFNLLFIFKPPINLAINIYFAIVLLTGFFIVYDDLNFAFTMIVRCGGIMVFSSFISNYNYNYQYNKFVEEQELTKKNIEMLTANTTLKMQSLQSQMNPHFTFNTLNAIQHFLLTNDKETSLNYLSKFAQLMRRIFKYSDDRLINFENEIEFLTLYLKLEQLRFEDKVKVEMTLSDQLKLKKNKLKIPPLLIQPLVENAFKHGLLHREEGGLLNISFDLKGSSLQCLIEDNGVGREQAAINASWKVAKENSGLSIIHKRIELLNTQNNTTLNQLTITDLTNKHDKAIGTKVELLLEV